MDQFTERILERARERQKKLLEYSDGESTELTEVLINGKSQSAPLVSSTPAPTNLEHEKRKFVISESNLCCETPTDNRSSLKESVSEGNLPRFVRQNSKTNISSHMPGSPQQNVKTLNIQKDNFNMEIKLQSTENVRIEVELQEESGSDDEGKENCDSNLQNCEPPIREEAKKRLQRLGKLYAGGDDADISSPIHRTEANFSAEEESTKKVRKIKTANDAQGESRRGLGGLAALAQNINQWDDNLSTVSHGAIKPGLESKISTPKKSWKLPAPKPPITNNNEQSPVKSAKTRMIKAKAPQPPREVNLKVEPRETNELISPKEFNLDPSTIETLESQGFTRTTSNTRLIYNYTHSENPNVKEAQITCTKREQNIKESIDEESDVEECDVPTSQPSISKLAKHESPQSPIRTNIKGSAIANRAAMFENTYSSPTKTNSKDPALLSVSERTALFEKNKGSAPIPKAPISMGAPVIREGILKATNLISPTKTEKSTTTSYNKSPPKKDGNRARYPLARPPIRKNDQTDSAAYRVAPGESGGIASKMAALFENKSTISQLQIESNIKEQRQKEMNVLLNRFQKNKDILPKTIPSVESESESDDETNEERAMITQRKPPHIIVTSIPPPPPPPPTTSAKKRRSGERRFSSEDSPKVAAVLEDVKRIKVTGSKPGRLYPCLSDIEAATETETELNTASPTPNNSSLEDNCYESDVEQAAETSFGREILRTVCKNQTSPKPTTYEVSTESDMSDILDDMDDYLDEALAFDAANKSGPTPPKQGRLSSPIRSTSSFQYKKYSPHQPSPKINASPEKDFKTPTKVCSPRTTDELPTYVVDGDSVLPLTHTVSFYRRQQTQESKTPVRQISRQPIIEESQENGSTSSTTTNNIEVQNKIQQLLDEMTKQQTIISQTSQALNLCYSTPEFTGSTEQVEAEKVLLLSTHRRSAAQREMERLSVLQTLHPENKSMDCIIPEKGSLTLSNIVLPLKREYVRALNATGGKGHHVVCLIKCAEQVLPTQLVSTVATNDRNPNLELSIPGTIHIHNIYSNFTVQLEVYCLQAKEEVLPHEVKYHINNKKSSNKLTPKKGKGESRLLRPLKESPGGPQAVRSPTFALMGYVVFSIQAINRKNWSLNNTPSMSPLEGIVEMRVKCELDVSVEHRGFLTMFEDISGFGAWHRRWCLLKGPILSYWKYPDEEKKKAPIDSIDIKNCITQNVGPVRRDICARLHTILLETTRLGRPHDKNSLVMECKGDTTIIRHLLSADTKEERIEWCNMFNKTLAAMKMSKNPK